MDFCGKLSGFEDFENTVDRGSAVIFSGLCLSSVRTLGPKRNLDHRSFVSFDRYVSKFANLFLFFERSSFKPRRETVIGFVLCCCHQACCLLDYLGEINSGIGMYQFTFEPLHFCFRMWLWFRIWVKILAERRIWRKKARIGGFAYPYSPPSYSNRHTEQIHVMQNSKGK